MKIFKKNIVLINILILILILFSYSMCKSKKYNSRRTLNKISNFSTKNSKDLNIKSFKLIGDSHLIAKCPEKTLMIKLIFEKNNNSNKIDIGFNCRSEPDLIGIEKSENIITTKDIDTITPPNIECKNNSVLTGIEILKNNDKFNFIWYCVKLNKIFKNEIIKTNLFINNKDKSNFAREGHSFEDKKFLEFLVHTDIKVDNTQKQGIKFIKFNRKSDNSLIYEYGVVDLE